MSHKYDFKPTWVKSLTVVPHKVAVLFENLYRRKDGIPTTPSTTTTTTTTAISASTSTTTTTTIWSTYRSKLFMGYISKVCSFVFFKRCPLIPGNGHEWASFAFLLWPPLILKPETSETSGNGWETSGNGWETSGNGWETSGNGWETSGNEWELVMAIFYK